MILLRVNLTISTGLVMCNLQMTLNCLEKLRKLEIIFFYKMTLIN